MARIASRHGSLPLPLELSDENYRALEAVLGKTLDASQRDTLGAAINRYRDQAALQLEAGRPRLVADRLEKSVVHLDDLLADLTDLICGEDDCTCASREYLEDRLAVARCSDPEVLTLAELSRVVTTTRQSAARAVTDLRQRYADQKGRDPDEPLDSLLRTMAEILKSAGVRVTANYSQDKGGRPSKYVLFSERVVALARGQRVHGAGIAERCARILKVRETKPAAKNPSPCQKI